MTRRARRTAAVAFAAALLVGGTGGAASLAAPAPPTPDTAAETWDAAAVGAPELQNCFNAAQEAGAEAWVCTGDGLTVTAQDAEATSTFTSIPAPQAKTEQGPSVAAAEPSPDSWCENGGICNQKVSSYIAWTKGNAAYGDADGAIGSWDNTIRVNLNGRSPRYTLTEVLDSGPTLYLDLTLDCREVPAPYSWCGNSVREATISAASRTWSSGLINGSPLSDATSYRALVGGHFTAAGESLTWTIGQLGSMAWNCPASGNCTFP
jgi:hypothetical protein